MEVRRVGSPLTSWLTNQLRRHSVKHGGTKNMEAARISVPSQIQPCKYDDSGKVTLYKWRTDLAASEPFWQGSESCYSSAVLY